MIRPGASSSVMTLTPACLWQVVEQCNQLAKPDKVDILEKLRAEVSFHPDYQPFRDRHSAEKIVEKINGF